MEKGKLQVFIGDKAVDVTSGVLNAEEVETKNDWSNKSFTAQMTVEDTPELRAFLKSMTSEAENRRKELEKYLEDIATGWVFYNKEGLDVLEKNLGKDFTQELIKNLRAAMLSGLRLGWNECYEYHNGKFNGTR